MAFSRDGFASSHGVERIRGRLGLPAKAVERTVNNALARGQKRTEFSGSLRRYLDRLWHRGRELNAAENIIVYGNTIYLFAGTLLVTAWPLPQKYSNASKRHGKDGNAKGLAQAGKVPPSCG
jgi:hypothetical protein